MKEDLKQYMTNLLYRAYDEADSVSPDEFDKWVEEMIDGIDGYFNSIEITDNEIEISARYNVPIGVNDKNYALGKRVGFVEGAKWMRDKIDKI